MAKAKFHSFRGEKSALILVKANDFVFSASPVYVPRIAVIKALRLASDVKEEDIANKDFEIPDGFKLAPMLDEDGKERTTQPDAQGQVHTLMCLVY